MLKSDLGIQQTEASLWDKSSFLDAALGVNKFMLKSDLGIQQTEAG
jgi:hypothetical protein